MNERELRKLQEKFREALSVEYSLSVDKEHLEESLKIAQGSSEIQCAI